MTRNRLTITTLISILALLFCILALPTLAQESTAEPTPAATVESAPFEVVTQEAAPVSVDMDSGSGNVTINTGGTTPVTPPDAAADTSPLGLLLVVGVGFVGLIVTISFGLQAIGNRAAAAAANPLEVAVLEKVADGIPSTVVTAIITPLKESLERSDEALQKVLLLLSKITDGVPEASKPTTPVPPVSPTRILTDPGSGSGGGGAGSR